jgi:hypothetical protein
LQEWDSRAKNRHEPQTKRRAGSTPNRFALLARRLKRVRSVIFFFEQGGRFTRFEVQPRPDGASDLIVTPPDGSQTIEVLAGVDVTRRITELRESLLQAGWWGPVGREF